MEITPLKNYIYNPPNKKQIEIELYSKKLLIAVQIELFRIKNKLTKTKMAELLEIGKSDYSKLINGNKSLDITVKLLFKLGINFDFNYNNRWESI